MKIYSLHCQEPWFSYLKRTEKTVEGRLKNDECKQIRVGNQIKFYNEDQSFCSTVLKVEHFTTLSNYLETVGLQHALPEIKTIEEGCNIYLQFYSKEEIQEYGMLAFWIKPMQT